MVKKITKFVENIWSVDEKWSVLDILEPILSLEDRKVLINKIYYDSINTTWFYLIWIDPSFHLKVRIGGATFLKTTVQDVDGVYISSSSDAESGARVARTIIQASVENIGACVITCRSLAGTVGLNAIVGGFQLRNEAALGDEENA
jgi:hypothetical protein